jgi:uncharacterized protein
MIPDLNQIKAIHQRYAQNDTVFKLVFEHCEIVTRIALDAAERSNEQIDKTLLQAACMLHDIGTYALFDENGRAANHELYPQHAQFGAILIRNEGFSENIAAAVETHVLMGLTKQEVQARPWPLPPRDYEPASIEGELLCYADRFHSKKPQFNSYEMFYKRLNENLPLQAAKFKAAAERFGLPDLEHLARAYNHPIV